MDHVLSFEPSRFQQALARIRRSHMTKAELKAVETEGDLNGFIQLMQGMNSAAVHQYAQDMSALDLYRMVHALKQGIEGPLKKRLVGLLSEGAHRRLFAYTYGLLLADYDNAGLLAACQAMRTYMEKNHPIQFGQTLLSALDPSAEQLAEGLVQAQIGRELDLNALFSTYDLPPDHGLAQRLIKSFFSSCTQKDYAVNRTVFADTLRNPDVEAIALAARYLRVCGPQSYLKDINEALFNRFGEPEKGHTFWTELDPDVAAIFTEWLRTHTLREYLGSNKVKLNFWVRYFLKVSTLFFEEDGLLILRLPRDYVVVDLAEDPNGSYLYKAQFFEQQYSRYLAERARGKSGWPLDKGQAVFIRDAQINNIPANIFRIVYSGVGRLYTMEIIEDHID